MANSLEVRVPLLDHRVVEFAAGVPLSAKLDNGRSKILLRNVLRRFVPDHLVERPKHGFSVPLGAWLNGPLAPLVEEYLGNDALAAQDLLDSQSVRDELRRFRAGQSPPGNIWALLDFQMWMMRHGLQRGAEVA
jgi:asparagine synthase (glutamine-hydrolysing)